MHFLFVLLNLHPCLNLQHLGPQFITQMLLIDLPVAQSSRTPHTADSEFMAQLVAFFLQHSSSFPHSSQLSGASPSSGKSPSTFSGKSPSSFSGITRSGTLSELTREKATNPTF